MSSFRSQRDKLTPQVTALFDFIWEQYLKHGGWPTNRVIYGTFKKEEIRPVLGQLSGSLIREIETNGQKCLELTLLGILCTTQGAHYLSLLRRYLDFLRSVYFERQDINSIRHSDVQSALNLSQDDTAMLGRLVFSGFLQGTGGHQNGFAEWGLSIPSALEDLPSSGSLDAAFEGILDRLSDIKSPVFLAERLEQMANSLKAIPLPESPISEAPVHNSTVFISYSHDDKEHKRWTLQLAQRLYEAGIDVIIDQWELGLGDDVAKFMENSVRRADRVLMICTEPYVKKVDEGKGGAGYEGMIVTSELIKNVGTAKFIPVIRQAAGAHEVPKCVSTRSWTNLSVGGDLEEELGNLIRTLRKEPPPTKPNRNIQEPEVVAAPIEAPKKEKPVAPSASRAETTASETYNEAMALARADDMVQWRKLVGSTKAAAEESLKAWRPKAEESLPRKEADLPQFALDGLSTQERLFVVALAGVESGRPKFVHQSGLIYDLMKPKGWEPTGYTIIAEFPETNAFVFQALIGSMAVFSEQNKIAIDLANQRIVDRRNPSESHPLFLDHPLIGWPRTMNGTATTSWNLLMQLPERFSWIRDVFTSGDTYRECLCGYYIMLSWMEFIEWLKKDPAFDGSQRWRLDVPPMFLSNSSHVHSAMRRVLVDREPLLKFSERSNITAELQIKTWGSWCQLLRQWIVDVDKNAWFRDPDSHIQHFAADLHR